jgi:hypothetical protein
MIAMSNMPDMPKLKISPTVGIKPIKKSTPNRISVNGILNLLSNNEDMVSIVLNSGELSLLFSLFKFSIHIKLLKAASKPSASIILFRFN